MIPLVLLCLAALMALTFDEVYTKPYGVRAYVLAFATYSALLVLTWLCVALPVLLWMKG